MIFIMVFSNILFLESFTELNYNFKEIIIMVTFISTSSFALEFLFEPDIKIIICEEISKIIYYFFLMILYNKFSNLENLENITKSSEILEKTIIFLSQNIPHGLSLYKSYNIQKNIHKKLIYEKNFCDFLRKDNNSQNDLIQNLTSYLVEKSKPNESKKTENQESVLNLNVKDGATESDLIDKINFSLKKENVNLNSINFFENLNYLNRKKTIDPFSKKKEKRKIMKYDAIENDNKNQIFENVRKNTR